jgi:hypothetical protein
LEYLDTRIDISDVQQHVVERPTLLTILLKAFLPYYLIWGNVMSGGN